MAVCVCVYFFWVRVPVGSAGGGSRGGGGRGIIIVALFFLVGNTATGRGKGAKYPRHLASSVCLSFGTRVGRLLSCNRRRFVGAEEEEEEAVDAPNRRGGDGGQERAPVRFSA